MGTEQKEGRCQLYYFEPGRFLNQNHAGPGCATIRHVRRAFLSLRRGTRAESAVLGGKQVASAGHDGGVLRQWLRLPLHRGQTPDPEEVKWARMGWPARTPLQGVTAGTRFSVGVVFVKKTERESIICV